MEFEGAKIRFEFRGKGGKRHEVHVRGRRNGDAQGRNLELSPNRRIVQTWRSAEFPDTAPDSRIEVTFEDTAHFHNGGIVPGDAAFRLYDTHGFPLDLTQDALRLRGITVDQAGFDAAMAAQKAEARKSWSGSGEAATDTVWYGLADKLGPTEFLGYETTAAESEVVGIIAARQLVEGVDEVGHESPIAVVLDRSPFYGEAGGQVGEE